MRSIFLALALVGLFGSTASSQVVVYGPRYSPYRSYGSYYGGYYGGGPYGIPYRLRGNAFYTQQYLGPPVYGPGFYRPGFYGPGFYGPRGGVGVGVGVF